MLAKSTTIEYGSNIRLTSISSNTYVNTPITTINSPTSWLPNFTWNSADGYTIGAVHNHPAGSAPSPDDVFYLMYNLTNPDLVSTGGASGINFYRNNAFVKVVTNTTTFVVRVNNWAALSSLFQSFQNNEVTFDNNFIEIATDYKLLTSVDDGTVTAYALGKVFGDSISIYKAATGTTNYVITSVDQNNNIVISTCPE